MLILQVFLLGCAKPPTEEMLKAEKAIDEARQKEADIYAKEIFNKSERSFIKAKEFVSARKYDEAKQTAIETVQLAKQAVTIAEINKEEERHRVKLLQDEAGKLRLNAREAIDELRSLEKNSFRKRSLKRYEELQKMITMWDTDVRNIKDSSREDSMIQTTAGLKKLLDEIETEKQKIQSSLIKTKKR